MYNLTSFTAVLESVAPLEISRKMIEQGDYDNSGVLVKCHQNINKVIFSLDLTEQVVKKAIRLKCDTVVTHHPAIYYPIKNLDCDSSQTGALLKAIKNDLNVISMHLNLDCASSGIDHSLCEGLGGQKYRIIFDVDGKHGYGREFEVKKNLGDLVKEIRKTFATNKLIVYGKPKTFIKKAVSFCGGGAGQAEKCIVNGLSDADLIVTSDMAHHVIKELVEMGKCIILMPHYVAEEYGFKKFFEQISLKLPQGSCIYFDDKRFR